MTEAADKGTEGARGEVILERGATIDRFVVLGLVGRGGMGEVYAAYDPELDRKVAIKLLRARGDSEEGRARLLREAQATAKLQHPNVVVVYDVGTYGQSVFVAMEFIEGHTVNGWQHAAPRSRREIMDVYLAAGRGLAAAHAAGLVHRDFKPDNVMVTNDGQVRVMDFGLARQLGEPDAARPSKATLPTESAATAAERAAASEALSESYDPEATRDLRKGGGPSEVVSPSGKYLSLKLTQTGAMLGTPAYMAPEQFAVKSTDARTDQFSFCVALYEALYGKRPFEGQTFLALMTSVTTGAVSPAPPKTKVPGWMRKVLLRGLQTDPNRRHPSMSALLTALQSDPTVRARRAAGLGLGLAALVAAVVGARQVVGSRGSMCGAGVERLAGVWEPGGPSPRKESIRRAFLATRKTFAERAFSGASHYLDEYVAAWLSMYRDACEATQVRGEQSAEVLDLRMGCLHERLVDLRALTDELATGSDKIVENAVSATSSLPGVDRCSDVALLRTVVKPTSDEGARKRVEQLREQKARLLAMRFTSKCDEGKHLEADLLPAAREIGYLPLRAEAAYAAAIFEDSCGGSSQAKMALNREAFSSAIASRHDRFATETALFLADGFSDRERDLRLATEWLAIGRALVARIGGDGEIRAELYQAEGSVAAYAGDYDSALAWMERCRTENVTIHGPDHPYVAMALNGIGMIAQLTGRYDDGLAALRRSNEIMLKATGPDHPLVAMLANNTGELLNSMRRYPEARAEFQRALDIWNAQHADAAIFAYGETGLGLALLGEGRPADAITPLERALAARTDAKAPSELMGETRFALARALWSKSAARARALDLARRARGECARSSAPTAKNMGAEIEAWLRAHSSAL